MSSRTGPTTLRVISTAKPTATSIETTMTISSSRERDAVSASTPSTVRCVDASIESCSLVELANSRFIAGETLPV